MAVWSKKEVRQPAVVLPSDVDDGEIQHIDYLAVQPSCVMKDFSVKHTVYDIAHGACRDEGEPKHHPELGVFLGKTEQKENQYDDRDDSENAQEGFHGTAASHPSECHAGILNEQQLEPIAKNRYFLANLHVRLDPNLENLIDDQDGENDDERADQAFAFCLCHFFFSFIFASRQIVVVGTQRNLSLGISLPVARQTP